MDDGERPTHAVEFKPDVKSDESTSRLVTNGRASTTGKVRAVI